MNNTLKKWGALAGILILTACGSDGNSFTDDGEEQPTGKVKEYYFNPVLKTSVPDPTVIRANDGLYYMYGTEDIWNMPIFKSCDMVNWAQVGTVFTGESRPTKPAGASLWAPEIRYIKGKYVIFYSLARWGDWDFSTIGYAIADKPEGPFTAQGTIFNSGSIGVPNCIDEYFYEENGRYYMLCGSFGGLFIVELNVADDLSTMIPKMSTKKQLAGSAYEAVALWKRNGYYYLFASIGSCCEGINSTYTTVVGRSENLRGPYITKSGHSMMNNAHEVLIARNDRYVGVGHCSILQEDDEKNTWMFYHGYQVADGYGGRQIFLDRVFWDENDWPYVKGQQPSSVAECPVFNK